MFLPRRPMAWIALSATAVASLAAQAQVSSQRSVTDTVLATRTYTLPTLQALPAVTQTDTFLMGNAPLVHTHTGTSLWGVLNASGIVTSGAENDILKRYVLATGSDDHKTLFSMGELNPSFGNQPDPVADAETINGVSAPLGSDGFARTNAPADLKGSRYVSNLNSLEVFDAPRVPEPATVALMVLGVAGLVLRQRQEAAAKHGADDNAASPSDADVSLH